MKKLLFALFCLIGLTLKAQNTHILPTPQQVEWQDGNFNCTGTIFLNYDKNDSVLDAMLSRFNAELNQIHPIALTWKKGIKKNERCLELLLVERLEDVKENEEQAYKLQISSNFIRIEATSETGLFYGLQSLKQLYRHAIVQGKPQLACMTILDWPDFKLRGWSDDISRGPIMSMDFLKRIIPQMAEFKANFFTLYTEHTFRTESHPDVAPIDAFTAAEIKELDALCQSYHIELIGNQQCFAHFEEILKNPFYSDIADTRYNVNPNVEASYTFIEDLIKEEAAAYTSPLFNINCDETESLGGGKAKAYVDSVGTTTAYYRHLNRVNAIVKKYGKRAMMWGDIADSHPEIMENLDKDIIMLAWSYVARDSFDEFLQPYVKAGHDFMVAPGLSLSGSVWPDQVNFESNIPHLCRDGYRNGAFGVMNTCWDDFGESQSTAASFGLALGAEMSWNTLKHTEIESANKEQAERHIDENFATQFFGLISDMPCSVMREVSQLAQTNGLGRFTTLNEAMTPFYPSQVGDSVENYHKNLIDKWFNPNDESQNLEKRIQKAQESVLWNGEIFNNALYAARRMKWCAQRNITRCQLERTYRKPSEANIIKSKQQIDKLIADLHRLKCDYITIWEQESRPCYLEVNMLKYDAVAKDLQQLEFLPFIEQKTNPEGMPVVSMRTIFNDKELHFTIDGKNVSPDDPMYRQPIPLSQSCVVKAKCFDGIGNSCESERYFLFHKGMGRLKQLNSPAGNYRPEYSGGGDNALLDGNLGGNDYKDGKWQGFYGVDADIEIDFGEKTDIHALRIGFLVNAHDWILRPNEVEIHTSNDGKNYKTFSTFTVKTEVSNNSNVNFRERFETPDLKTRYLRVVVKNPGLIPEGLPGHGYDSWIFMDEMIVE